MGNTSVFGRQSDLCHIAHPMPINYPAVLECGDLSPEIHVRIDTGKRKDEK